MKIAVLSNVNMDGVIRLLGRDADVYQTQGYGNELGALINQQSAYHSFQPGYTFLLMDLMELLEHDLEPASAEERIREWFGILDTVLTAGAVYYISDAYLWGTELAVLQDTGRKAALEGIWQRFLEEAVKAHANVRIFPYRHLIEEFGEENAFSMTMWYMGRIPLTNEAQKRLARLILDKLRVETATPKKLLLLDLDNTLWGGLAGERDHTPITLSEDHVGLAYKNLQRMLLLMQKQGVLLAVVSKNDERDVSDILENHPHMVLRRGAFAAVRVNWKAKHENIMEIADELNLGMDSFVFWDDNPQERQLVRELLPQVAVPDFPDRPEKLAPAMAEIYREYFAKASLTEEDLGKTAQYAANAERHRLRDAAGTFEDYLKGLKTVAERVEPEKNTARLAQLVNKTNQFNLTSRRFTQAQIEGLLREKDRRVYLYRISDRFGDSGIAAAVFVDCSGNVPVIDEFVMSCRVMGRNIEFALAEDVEKDLLLAGYKRLKGIFLPTDRNGPAEKLYGLLGYEKTADLENGGAEYEISLDKIPKRMYYVKVRRGTE